MVPEDRSYQAQYFAKILSSPLASMPHISFYHHLKESSENVLWIVITLKSSTFSALKSATTSDFETTYFMLSLKNLTKICSKSWWLSLFWWNRSIFHIFWFFFIIHLLLLGKIPQPCMAGEKFSLWSTAFVYFPQNTSDHFYLLQILLIFSVKIRKP